MNYEKEYNKALEKARKLYNDAKANEYKSDMEDYESIFPELAESEDERIRKWLYDYFSTIKEMIWIHRDITCEQILDWLEKQKECVSNNFDDVWDEEDCEEIIAEGQKLTPRFKELLKEVCHAWYDRGAKLEKQQENPNFADSIPSDCVSDAKCEDRWHKVGDSLPDNGRLVLANDCLGNTLLARYDGEGNWEVSVYDNDDYYCRNTITKWCEIPSEKQKEQKSAERSEEDEEILKLLILNIGRYKYFGGMSSERILAFLKSLRPQYHGDVTMTEAYKMGKEAGEASSWKPSEEQMEALESAVKLYKDTHFEIHHKKIVSLYEQLKQL